MDSHIGNSAELGSLVQASREGRALSRRELAKLVGCRDRWIERLELGLIELPHPATLGRITEVLRLDPVEVDWLSGGQLEGWYPGLKTWFRPRDLSAAAALAARRLFVRRQQERHGHVVTSSRPSGG